MNLNDLPDEMLCTIFDYLDVYELKPASLVCRRWSDLTFSGRRMDRVMLVKRNPDCEFLFNTKRKYRNVHQPWVTETMKDDHLKSLVRLLHTIKPHVRMLVIEPFISSQQVRQILLEVPELLHLSFGFAEDNCNTYGTFPVLSKLKSLVLNASTTDDSFYLSFTRIANLQCLEMDCWTDLELEAWTYFSGQLKLVHVSDFHPRYLHPFLELTFPRLEDLYINMLEFDMNEMMGLERSSGFFRRHPFLRELSLCGFLTAKCIRIISHHCPELTHLSFHLEDTEDGFLESLVRLTKLKHLSLDGNVVRKCWSGAFKSLESVALEVPHPQDLLENLFEVAPRLSCLRITDDISCDELQFICEKFSYLRSLELVTSSDEFLSGADDSVRFDKLMHLQDLELSGNIKIRFIRRNNVRCLTMFRYGRTDEDYYQIPEKFPFLKRLIVKRCLVSVVAVQRLHKLMPSCRIDFNDKRFYPVNDGTAD